jgi:hypothetical protein
MAAKSLPSIEKFKETQRKVEINYLRKKSKEANRKWESLKKDPPKIDPEIADLVEIMQTHDFGGYRDSVKDIIKAIIKKYMNKEVPDELFNVSSENIEDITPIPAMMVVLLEEKGGHDYPLDTPVLVCGRRASSMITPLAQRGNTGYGLFRLATNEEIDLFYSYPAVQNSDLLRKF